MQQNLPASLKFVIVFFGLMMTVVTVYYLQDILLPFVFALLFAMLLNPLSVRLERKLPRFLAVLFTVLTALVCLLLLIYFLSTQMGLFAEAFPEIKQRFSEGFHELQQWISSKFHISLAKQAIWLNEGFTNLLNNGTKFIGTTLSLVTGVAIVLTIIPVYIFLFLYYRVLLYDFLLALFSKNTELAKDILVQGKKIIQQYVFGLLIEGAIVAALNSVGLLLLGIEYAVLFGVIGAILNVVPYIGGIIAISLPLIIALVTKSFAHALGVVAVYLVIQFIDNHFLIPKIVASKVKLNALVSIIGVIAGGALCGIPGMFLSIPFLAILKIIFDRIPSLTPWGILLGEGDETFAIKKKKHQASI